MSHINEGTRTAAVHLKGKEEIKYIYANQCYDTAIKNSCGVSGLNHLAAKSNNVKGNHVFKS